MRNAFFGVYLLGVGIIPSVAACAVIPVFPAIAGIAVAPVDAVITLEKFLLNSNDIAARKFKKLINGASSKANKSVFKVLKSKINKI